MLATIPPSDSDDPCDDWSGYEIVDQKEKRSQRPRWKGPCYKYVAKTLIYMFLGTSWLHMHIM